MRERNTMSEKERREEKERGRERDRGHIVIHKVSHSQNPIVEF